MPSRTRQSASNTEVAEPDDPSALRHLKFNEPLTWRVGRQAIPIADLLRRLQSLSQELRKLEQEEVEKESLKKVSQELATAQLLAHKDKGVRAWVACCVVDVLRLCAPDAPFTANQLKVFSSFLGEEGAVYAMPVLTVVGSLHLYRHLHHPHPGGPLQHLQCAAYLRVELPRGGQEYCFDDRPGSARFLDHSPVHHLL